MKKTLPLVAGLAGSLFVSGMAQGGFLGISLVAKEDPDNPRFLICNLFIDFDSPTDSLLGVFGLIQPGQPGLFFSTNSSNGFNQEQVFGNDKNFAVSAGELNFFPLMAIDTYFNVGIKSGEVTASGIESATASDESASSPIAITFGWNLGGKSLFSDPVVGGGFQFALFAALNDQNNAGATPAGNSIFLAQLVIDTNRPTNDGNPARIDVQIANLIWTDAAGVQTLEGFDPGGGGGQALTASHIVPAPGTLALLGLAGLAGIRRRRR